MKSLLNPFVRLSSLITAAAVPFAASALAVDYTWDGGTGNWNATNWNGATASGPTTAGNTATINSGNVTANVGGPGNVDSITLGSGAQLNLYNGDGGIFAYGYFPNLILQGGTVNGGSGTYNAYGASILTNVTVSGSAASTITGASWFNMDPTTTFTVADATGDSNTDLLVSTSLRGPAGSPDWTYNTTKLVKEGAGTMEVTVHSYFRGGLDLNGGALKVSGGNSGYGFFDGTVNVNSGTTLSISSDGTGLGWQGDWKPDAVNINGGTITTAGANHIWGISGGVNMTGGTLQSNDGVSDPNGAQLEWNYTNLNTNASADTATVGGRIRMRADGGYGGISFNVADGAAATDLLVSAAVNEASGGLGITKSGDGTMVMSGTRSYTGTTVVNGGTLVISGDSSAASGSIIVDAGVLSLGDGANPANLDDSSAVLIASGTQVDLNFSGNEVIGSLDIDSSGPLPPGTYNSSTPVYGSYFTGTGSLVILGADSNWTSLADGNWSDSANWASSTVATGYDATATFNAATGATVTLDTNRIIGNLSFDVSDYTISGASTLTLDSTGTPTVAVTAGRTATISAGLAGIYGMEKTGGGTLVLSGVKSYTGGTLVADGTLELNNSSTFDVSAISGSLTVENGATLKLSGLDFTGLGRLGARVTYLEVIDATVENTVMSWVNGASVNLTGSTMSGGQYHIISSGFYSLESATTSTISSNLLIRKDYGSTDLSFDVADGSAANDLLVSGNVGDVFPAGLIKSGPGKLVLSGTNTYVGNTVVTDGALEVTSGLRFRPTTNGTTNSVSGSATGTLSFLGTVSLDLSAADATNANVWNLFNLASFSGPAPTLSPAAVTTTTLGSFTEVSAGVWELAVTGAKWVFTTADGNLTYSVTATDYGTWETANGVVGGEDDDDDADGLTNAEEYAFGLNPTSGAEVNAIAVPLDKATGTFSYTRRTQALTGLSYSVWYSTDLSGWTEDSGAVEGTPAVTGEVETVPVTISPALLSNTKLFIQVRAE